jgi:DNA-binding transcriptional regulator GbsR (MarR family)
MKYREVLEDAKKELQEEKREMAKEEIKERLREIELARESLDTMEAQLEEMLDADL